MTDSCPGGFSVCVFCGASSGSDPVYAAQARAMGARIAREGFRLVYGGGSVGLMGVLADACLEAGGEVIGVIPEGLFHKEICHSGVSELIVVDSMHTRKATMARLSDAFVALPGGYGTLEELFEVTTWGQLGIHDKPAYLLNTKGFFGELLRFLNYASSEGFIQERHRRRLVGHPSLDTLFDALKGPPLPPERPRWLDPNKT